MFLTPRAEDSGDRSVFGDFWFKPVQAHGVIDSEQALRLAVVYRCVRLLSDTLSQLPFTIYRKRRDGSRQILRNHWLYGLMAVRPNDYQNPVQFRQMMQSHLELRGNAYARIVSDRSGLVTDLLPIHPDRVSIDLLDGGNWRYRVKNKDGTETILARGQVWHRYDMTLDGIVGVNPISYARDTLATGLAAQSYGRRFFENNGSPGGIVKVPYKFANDEQRRLARSRWQQALSGRNQGKLAVFEMGEEFTPVAVTNVDAQFIESKKYTVSDICRMFGVPPHKVGDLDRSTNNNIEQQSLDYIIEAIQPRANCWIAALKYDLLDLDAAELEIELSIKPLLLADSAARKNYYQGGIQSGWLTRNEVRMEEGRDPLDGLDDPLQPVNMQPVGEEEEEETETPPGQTPKQPGAPDAPPPDQPGRPPADSLHRRALALATAAAERIARKEAAEFRTNRSAEALEKFYAKHCSFVSAALGIEAAAAATYCDAQLRCIADNPHMDADEFTTIACSRLERLALGV